MTPLERAARALYQRLGTEIADPENLGEDERWPEFVDDARAVLQAIREPSDAMLDAAGKADPLECRSGEWRAMIDAAMEEQPPA